MDEKKKIKNPYIKNMLAEAGAFILAILFFFILYEAKGIGSAFGRLRTILRPFLIGFVIAYLLAPVCKKLEKWFSKLFAKAKWGKKLAGILAVFLSIAFGLLVVYVLIIMIVPQMYNSIVSLSVTLQDEVDPLTAKVELMLQDNPTLLGYVEKIYDKAAESINGWVTGTVIPQLKNLIGGVGTGVVSVVVSIKDVLVGIVVAVYALFARTRLAKGARLLLYSVAPTRWADTISEEMRFADKMFSGFISGKLLDSAIIGVLCYFFCVAAGMPNELLISAIIGITNVIPVFGPFIGAVPTSLLILIENPSKFWLFVIFVIVLQQLDGNVIGPKILGNSTGISGFSVLFAIVLFGGLMGFTGMLVGVPLYAVMSDIAKKLITLGLNKHGLKQDGSGDLVRKPSEPEPVQPLQDQYYPDDYYFDDGDQGYGDSTYASEGYYDIFDDSVPAGASAVVPASPREADKA